VISIISMAVVFYIADLGRFVDALRLADYRLVAVAVLTTVLWLLVRAQAWRTLLREQATFSQVFWTVNEGYLLNNILPFRLGEIGRTFILSRKAHIGFWEVFSSILIERIIDLALAAGLLFITLPFVVSADWALEAALGVGFLVLLGFVLLYLLARNSRRAVSLYYRWSEKWTILEKFGVQRVEAFFQGLSVLTEGSRFLRAVGWIVLDWTIAVFQYYLLLLAFFPQAELLWGAFTLGVAAIGVAAPSSPGGVGVFELSVVGALSLFGLDASIALAFAISTHLIQILVTGLLGAYGFIRDGESLVGIYRRSKQVPQNPQ